MTNQADDRSFPVYCSECDMRFCQDLPEDIEHHQLHHDKVVNGVRFSLSDSTLVAWQTGEDRVVVVTPRSSVSERKLAEDVAMKARLDMDYDFAAFHAGEPWNDREVHMFLYERGDRVVGYARFERVIHARSYTWMEYANRTHECLPKHQAMWSVGRLWVNRNYRHKGIAKQLVIESARSLDANLKTIGWQDPFSADAIYFLRSLYPDHFILGK